MIHLIYAYFIINAFIAGYTFKDTYRWESITKTVLYTFFALLVGAPFCTTLFSTTTFAPILGWIYREIKFQYRFYFTNYWDKVLLDDTYSKAYKTTEEKLKRYDKLSIRSSEQVKRHNKKLQNKYGN